MAAWMICGIPRVPANGHRCDLCGDLTRQFERPQLKRAVISQIAGCMTVDRKLPYLPLAVVDVVSRIYRPLTARCL